jgi:hypothetical protein
MAAANEPASVILPAGTFKLDRSIEIMVDQKPRQFKLFRVLDRSIEFERCNFTTEPGAPGNTTLNVEPRPGSLSICSAA